MMKRAMVVAAFAAVAAWALPAAAQETRVEIEREDDQLVEVGIVAGFPSGVSAKYWLNRTAAVQGAAAWNPGTNGLNGTIDALYHTASFANDEEISLPLYAGLGARIVEYDNDGNDSEWAIGPRVPIGVEAILRDLPVAFFAEIAPAVEAGRGDPDLTADAAVGARVIF
jgi:hypothetical protein